MGSQQSRTGVTEGSDCGTYPAPVWASWRSWPLIPGRRSDGGTWWSHWWSKEMMADISFCPFMSRVSTVRTTAVTTGLTTSHLFRKMLLTSSWVMGGFLELAAMRRGRRKLLTRVWSCWTYSASASSMLNTTWFLFLILSAWGERM